MKTPIYCSVCLAAGQKTEAIKKITVQDVHYEFCEECYLDFLVKMNQEADKLIGQVLLYCLRCGHSWPPRGATHPRICPKCKSPYWDRKKQTKEA